MPLWRRVRWVPVEHNVARVKAYLHAKFHLDPSSRLATIHQRYTQDRQTDNGQIAYRANPFTNGRPKTPDGVTFGTRRRIKIPASSKHLVSSAIALSPSERDALNGASRVK